VLRSFLWSFSGLLLVARLQHFGVVTDNTLSPPLFLIAVIAHLPLSIHPSLTATITTMRTTLLSSRILRTLLALQQLLLMLIAAPVVTPSASAFSPSTLPATARTHTRIATRTTRPSVPSSLVLHQKQQRSDSSRLFLSDIPDDENSSCDVPSSSSSSSKDNNAKNNNISPQKWLQWFAGTIRQPEDSFTLIGDLLAIAVYGWTDHFFGHDLAQYLVAHTTIRPDYYADTAAQQLPAWTAAASDPVTAILRTELADQVVTRYSPLLQSTGAAATLLAVCWLVAGSVWGTFDYRRTLQCSSTTALQQTAVTWATAAALLLAVTVLANYGMVILTTGGDGLATTSILPTVGDVIFAGDVWSVLTLWRFLINFLLGSGEDGED